MNIMQHFLPLNIRAAVILQGLVYFLSISLIVIGVSDSHQDYLAMYVNPVVLAILLYPGAAGWVTGLVIKDFQQTSFAQFLPGVRFRIATGFLITGLVVTAITGGLISDGGTSGFGFWVLLAIGMVAYCFGGIIIDPLSNRLTGVNVTLTLAVLFNLDKLIDHFKNHPLSGSIFCLVIAVLALSRLFSLSTFRQKPSGSLRRLSGPSSFEESRQYRLRRVLKDGPSKSVWHSTYMGDRLWMWVRAAIYEAHGATAIKSVLRTASGIWVVVLYVLYSSWRDKGDMDMGEILAIAINDALFRSPFLPAYGERASLAILVVVAIAGIMALKAMSSPIALKDGLYHPLSRVQRAAILFRGSLVEAAILLLFAVPISWAIAAVLGWYAGFELRFDFMPYFLRVIFVTLILLPFVYWTHLQLAASGWRRAQDKRLAEMFVIFLFLFSVGLITAIAGAVFESALAELTGLSITLLISRFLYWRALVSFYTTADLA